jgi:hypothetical protein
MASDAKPLIKVSRFLVIAPWFIAIYAGLISVPTVLRRVEQYNAAAEARHLAEIHALAREKAIAHAEEIRFARSRRDSVLKALPKNRIRHASDRDLNAGLDIATTDTEDTVGTRWIVLAKAELSRRARIHDLKTKLRAAR